jgi:pilus assembly protein Flp/PilA
MINGRFPRAGMPGRPAQRLRVPACVNRRKGRRSGDTAEGEATAERPSRVAPGFYEKRSYSLQRLFRAACYETTRASRKRGERTMNLFVRFLRDQSGATAIEYGLIAAGISVAIIAVVNSLGSQLQTTFSTVSSQLATAGK